MQMFMLIQLVDQDLQVMPMEKEHFRLLHLQEEFPLEIVLSKSVQMVVQEPLRLLQLMDHT